MLRIEDNKQEFFCQILKAGVIILRRNAAGLPRHSLPPVDCSILGILTTGEPARGPVSCHGLFDSFREFGCQ